MDRRGPAGSEKKRGWRVLRETERILREGLRMQNKIPRDGRDRGKAGGERVREGKTKARSNVTRVKYACCAGRTENHVPHEIRDWWLRSRNRGATSNASQQHMPVGPEHLAAAHTAKQLSTTPAMVPGHSP